MLKAFRLGNTRVGRGHAGALFTVIPRPGHVFTVSINAAAFETLTGQFPTREVVKDLSAEQLEVLRIALKATLESARLARRNDIILITPADLR